VCDLETSRMGAPYIYDISRLRVNTNGNKPLCNEKSVGRYGCGYKQRNRSDTDNKQL